jgi:suppressor of ftsI
MEHQPRLTRRRFLAAGGTLASAAMLGLFHESAHATESAPVDAYTLNVGYSERTLAGLRIRSRTYNASLPGPLMVTRPGHILRVTLANSLPPDPAAVAPDGIDGENNPNHFNTTNLHVHGLQVIPHLFAPVGTSDPASRMIAIGSGQGLTYDFQLPEDHPAGLYWYHPHHHGSATVQVGGGMAGLILVNGAIDEVPEIAAARDELLAIQNPKINPLAGADGLWGWEPIAYKPADQGGYYFTTQMEFITVNGGPVLAIDRRGKKPVATRHTLPVYRMRPGEVIRLRMLNGTDSIPMPIALPGFEMYVIGQDGINLLKPERAGEDLKTAIRMVPGNRNEVLIRAPGKATTGTLIALPQMAASPNILSEAMGEMMATPEIALASFVVSGTPATMSIPETLPTPAREYPLIRDDEIAAHRKVVFTMRNGVKSILTGVEFLINNQLYSETRIDNTVRLGTAEEWTLANNSDGIHPFHIHVNSFEVMGMPGNPGYHRLHDTVWLAPFSELKMRTRFKTWKGKSVYHCHMLPHEDTAMIANFTIA